MGFSWPSTRVTVGTDGNLTASRIFVKIRLPSAFAPFPHGTADTARSGNGGRGLVLLTCVGILP